ncbi:MAG: AAA family ATPase [Paracoccaceae bacterium]
MTSATTTIPFSPIKFIDRVPKVSDVERRLKEFLLEFRQSDEPAESNGEDIFPKMGSSRSFEFNDRLTEKDRTRIRARAMRYVDRIVGSTGMRHLREEQQAELTALRSGLPIPRITTEHEADEIAAALHAEVPWMAAATEEVWHDMRASVRDGLPGLRLSPLVLVGSPGIGKSYWARCLADLLKVPTTKIDATGEPASFALVGSQKGWGSASYGKLVKTVLDERNAGPLVIIDEVEKAGEVTSDKGTKYALTEALLPLLERMTAETWQCPYFQIEMNMAWVNWVLTANSRSGLPEPLQSRCMVLDIPDLTDRQLIDFATREGRKRNLSGPTIDSLLSALEMKTDFKRKVSLRVVNRMLDRAEMLADRPMLH